MITTAIYRIGTDFFSIDLPVGAKILKVHTQFNSRPKIHVLININSTKTENRNFLLATVGEIYHIDIESLEHLGACYNANLFEIVEKKLFK